jgi:hypothetical protein
MRTSQPGPLRVCLTCEQIIPYPPAGLTKSQETKRQHERRRKGLPAEFAIACLDADGQPASQCVKCAQEAYHVANPHMRPATGGETDA